MTTTQGGVATERGERVLVDVLGPIRVGDGAGNDVTPDGALQRRLLALLVLRRGHVVSVDAAIDALWPSRRPRDPVAALHNHLFRLRRSLPGDAIASTGDGYRLEPARIDLDVDRLVAALASPERDDAAALATIDEILARWHGPAYPELDEVDDGRAEAIRLGELRIRAVEARAERRLAAGVVDGLVAELTVLADEEPLRERPRALLMAVLATTGRTAEALRVYDDFRRRLGAELGVEPSPALAAEHTRLLGAGVAAPSPAAGAAPDPAGTAPPAVHGPAVGPRRPGVTSPAWVPETRLPVPLTSLVGREALVADLAATAGTHRLVTLLGPGGVGKTRLLGEVGLRLCAARPDRAVVWCELATAAGESAVDAVAAAVGIDGRPGVTITERLTSVLAGAELVLLLDNCEHVLEPVAALVDRVLATCPHVTVLTTSRERLRVPGELLRPVPTLPTPPAPAADAADAADATAHAAAAHAAAGRAGASVAETSAAPAVRLFVERARAVAPDFDPDPGELAVVGEIVRRLDGLPLAIELAAARLHTLDVAEVAAGLDHRFRLLSSGYRTSARHGSLGAAMAWSVGLLDASLQQTFADLSVFPGSFTVADAAAICDLDPGAAAETLALLAERSLVMRAPDRRYVLLETLRAFGAEQLAASGRAEQVGERHARHQVAWIEAADRRLVEPGRSAIAEIDAALPDLRAALDWLLDHGHVELAGRLVVAMFDYGFLRLRRDVLAWAERVTQADPEDRSPLAPLVWIGSAEAAWMAGDVAESGARACHAVAIVEGAGGEVPAEVAAVRGNFELYEGRLAEAAAWYRRAREAAAGDRAQRLQATATEVLALAYAGDPETVDVTAELLAEVGEDRTPYAAYAWYCAGEAVLPVDVDEARARFDRALELAEETNAAFVTGVAGASRASIDARQGDPLAAAEDYRRVLAHWRRAGMWSTQWTILRSIAGLLARLGRSRDAAVLVGAVRSTHAGHRIFGDDEVALSALGVRLRAELGDEAYDDALGEGAALDGDAAVEHALHSLHALRVP